MTAAHHLPTLEPCLLLIVMIFMLYYNYEIKYKIDLHEKVFIAIKKVVHITVFFRNLISLLSDLHLNR